MYLGNSVNIEGLSCDSGDNHKHSNEQVNLSESQPTPKPKVILKDSVKQDLSSIGQKPTPLKPLNVPPSLEPDLKAVSSSSDNLASLDDSFGTLVDPQLIQNLLRFLFHC